MTWPQQALLRCDRLKSCARRRQLQQLCQHHPRQNLKVHLIHCHPSCLRFQHTF